MLISTDHREAILDKLTNPTDKTHHDETIWTWLLARCVEKSLEEGHHSLYNLLLGGTHKPHHEIGFEVCPLSTRGKGEGNTILDLALGDIRRRPKTLSGIEYNPQKMSSVSFVEAKFLSDLSVYTTNDNFRNQMIRIIENILCFQSYNPNTDSFSFPDQITFTLLTPRAFWLRPKTRLYGYKFQEYSQALQSNVQDILGEIAHCPQEKRFQKHWRYPILQERITRLKMQWVCYEDIFEIALSESFDLIDCTADERLTIINDIRKKIV